jgi:nucleotide-binding universal stress UspA family protein
MIFVAIWAAIPPRRRPPGMRFVPRVRDILHFERPAGKSMLRLPLWPGMGQATFAAFTARPPPGEAFMFKRILVTLDGSDFSERAIEPAFHVAQKFGAEVLLLRVVTPETVAAGAVAGPQYFELAGLQEQQEREAAEAYLRGLRRNWAVTEVPITTHVAAGAPPEMILACAAECDVDLIVMSTHGRSGLSRFLYGSVAEAVLRGTQLPLLLIPVK